jgi:hypothetical protein
MAPTLMRLEGAYWPKTVEGTIIGNPTAAAPARPACKTLRLETGADFPCLGIDFLTAIV